MFFLKFISFAVAEHTLSKSLVEALGGIPLNTFMTLSYVNMVRKGVIWG